MPDVSQMQGLTNKLAEITASVSSFLPEISLAVSIIIILIYDLITHKRQRQYLLLFALVALLLTGYLTSLQWLSASRGAEEFLFNDMLVLDKASIFAKFVFLVAGILTILMSWPDRAHKPMLSIPGEQVILLVGLVLGTFLLCMSVNLLMVYLALELISLCSYILCTMNGDKPGSEAGLKFILFGAVSSAFMLYGMSLFYGFTGSLHINDPSFVAGLETIHWLPLTVAGLLVISGFLFKIAAFPFQVWAPDVYQGSPTPIVAFFSVAPKIAGLFILIRFTNAYSFVDLATYWQEILAAVAILSMTVGNFAAIRQKNAKRMLAYSSIAHGGFLLCGLVTFTDFGLSALLFYAAIYVLMNFAAFLIVMLLEGKTHSLEMDTFKGLGLKFPVLGVLTIVAMIALTGLPPTAGFTAKFLIFSSIWAAYASSAKPILLYLLIFGLFNTVISLAYYLKIPYLLFFKESAVTMVSDRKDYLKNILLVFLIIPIILLFFKSEWLLYIINSITFVFQKVHK